mmetsp:Transcript_38105/g.96433  ORF Transcript_38105/g.96433 Transcript_38105/m.96433 type:complete len:289 (+) Transcript_38105:137-1003(+)
MRAHRAGGDAGRRAVHAQSGGASRLCGGALELGGLQELRVRVQQRAHAGSDCELAEVVRLGRDGDRRLRVLALPGQQMPHLVAVVECKVGQPTCPKAEVRDARHRKLAEPKLRCARPRAEELLQEVREGAQQAAPHCCRRLLAQQPHRSPQKGLPPLQLRLCRPAPREQSQQRVARHRRSQHLQPAGAGGEPQPRLAGVGAVLREQRPQGVFQLRERALGAAGIGRAGRMGRRNRDQQEARQKGLANRFAAHPAAPGRSTVTPEYAGTKNSFHRYRVAVSKHRREGSC